MLRRRYRKIYYFFSDAFEIENLDEYHDLHVQCNTSLLADVFENFRDKCIEVYELDRDHFLSASY